MEVQIIKAEDVGKFDGLKSGNHYVILSSPNKLAVDDNPKARLDGCARHCVQVTSIEKTETLESEPENPTPVDTAPGFKIPAIVKADTADKAAPAPATK